MSFDLVLRNGRLAEAEAEPMDIAIRDGRIAALGRALVCDAPEEDLGGRLVVPGFVETHVHLDKSCLLGRCACREGTLAEAVAAVAQAKRAFTEDDVYARAERTLRRAIVQGTMRMRTHVEADPRVGLTSVRALTRLKRDYAWAVALQLCIFPQEGLLDDPGCEEVLVEGLESGANVIGGAPYMDRDSHGQIARIFALARRYDVDIDLHLDFGLDPAHLDAVEVCRLTDQYGWGGRVAVGHVTKFSSVPPDQLERIGRMLAASGVAATVLPATDLFLTGRDHDRDVPRGVTPAHRLRAFGVTCSLSTNNVLNPFTPFGDCSLVRMANLYANICQIGTAAGLAGCLEMVTSQSARLLNLADYGIAEGNPADLVVLDTDTPANAVSELAQPLFGLKGGARTFTRPAPTLHEPR
jgi:cytosine/creatinine deaminase